MPESRQSAMSPRDEAFKQQLADILDRKAVPGSGNTALSAKSRERQQDQEAKVANEQFANDYPEILADSKLLAEANRRYYKKLAAGKSISEAMSEAGKETKARHDAIINLKPGPNANNQKGMFDDIVNAK